MDATSVSDFRDKCAREELARDDSAEIGGNAVAIHPRYVSVLYCSFNS
jgi:hypothetical protein